MHTNITQADIMIRILYCILCLFWILPGHCYTLDKSYKETDQTITLGEKEYAQENYVGAIKNFLTAKQQADKHNWAELSYYATMYLGTSYYAILEYGKALNYYYEAYKIHQENHLPEQLLEQLNSGIAGVYFEEKNYTKARELTEKSYQQALKRKDSTSIAQHSINLALIANKENRFQNSKSYIDTALVYAQKDSANLIRAKVIKTESHFMLRDYPKVLQLSKEILNSSHANLNDKAVIYTYLISIYKQQHPQKAIQLLEKIQNRIPVRQKPDIYELASDIYKNNQDLEKSILYKDSIIIYTDSINKIANRKLAENSKIQFEVLGVRQELNDEMMRLKSHRQLLFFLLCIIVLIILIILINFRHTRIRSQQNKKMMELQLEKEQQEKQLLERQMRETELIAQLQKEKLESSIAQKNKELAISSMFVSSRNELISELVGSLQQINETQHLSSIQEFIIHLKQLLKESDNQDDFLVHFEAANPSFIQTIRKMHPELTVVDIRFLAYIRMNLTSHEIASLLNITVDSLKRKKIRISKKLGLESSSILYEYLTNIG